MQVGTIYTLYGRRAGAELYFEKILTGMVEKYDDITFTIYCNDEAFKILPDSNSKLKKVKIDYLNNQFMKAIWLELLSAKIIENENVDLFWIPSGTNNFPGRWSIPNVVTFHDFGEYHIAGKYDIKRTVYRKMICIPRSIKRASSITTVSQTTAHDFNILFKSDIEPTVIYSGPSPRKKNENIHDPIHIIKTETSIDLDHILFTPGRTDYIGKGFDILLKAYKQLCEKHAMPKLVLAGPKGENHEKLITDIKKYSLDDKVIWLGRVSDACIDALYQISDVVIIASRYEGFGFPVLEAMEFDVPLVCSDAGALPEVAGDGAIIFKSEDVSQLCESIIEALNNEELRKNIIMSGRLRLRQFNWQKTFRQMQEVFIKTLSA